MTGQHDSLSPNGGNMRKSRRLVGQPLLYALTCFASLGVFLFGYDQGVMSGIITGPQFQAYFKQPNRNQIGTMVAILEVGAFITSIASGRVADIIGRRRTLFTGACIFVVGGAIQTFTTGFEVMVLGRIVSGFGVGLLSTIVPIYQSEISPAEHRGKLACIEFTGNIFGYASSVWIDYFASFLEGDWSWRLPLFMQCVIGGILAAGSLLLPESPRWLIDHDFLDEGRKVISDLHGVDLDDVKVTAEFDEIKDMVEKDRLVGDRSYLAMWRQYRQRVLIAMSSQAFAQLNGINVISYYAPMVFEQAGWIGREAILMTGINGVIYVLSTIPTWYLVDVWGRRAILMSGAAVMAVALTATGWFMYVDQIYTPNAVVVCVIVFNAAFGFSWGPIPWLYPPEIMPLAFRAKGVSMSTATNWLFNWIVGQVTPTLQEVIEWRLYPMHAFFCCCSFILVYFLYPETMGIPLEEMDVVFGEERPTNDDDDSETSSLVRGRHRTYDSPAGSRRSSPAPNQTWLGSIFGRRKTGDAYQAVPSEGDHA
ncbi:putative MFS monosaccharide transporter [Rhizoctonia solani 123E]|uniref:Putative MFS monosaccharide transporter n=1 Tax=Rhizoctonia solani 123E TaxID=1423351 RepID=A0A074S195_9AGAM|nr:putative MFS monosaccharide transporter [Rhizoctonia solani 123E]